MLQSGVQYYVRIGAVNAEGIGAFASSEPAMVTTGDRVPLAPSMRDMTVSSSTSLLANWDVPSSDGGETLESFVVE